MSLFISYSTVLRDPEHGVWRSVRIVFISVVLYFICSWELNMGLQVHKTEL